MIQYASSHPADAAPKHRRKMEHLAIVRQSVAIHPEWTPADHYSYLNNDVFVNVSMEDVEYLLKELGR